MNNQAAANNNSIAKAAQLLLAVDKTKKQKDLFLGPMQAIIEQINLKTGEIITHRVLY